MRPEASPGPLPTLGLPLEPGRNCEKDGRLAHTKSGLHSCPVFPKTASGFPPLESSCGRRGSRIWMSGSIAISVSTQCNEASMCPMKSLRRRIGQPSCFQRKGGSLATNRTWRKPLRRPCMTSVRRNAEVVTHVQVMELPALRIFFLRLHYQRLAMTIRTCPVGRHVAIQAGEFAFRSNRVDRAWFGRDRIRMKGTYQSQIFRTGACRRRCLDGGARRSDYQSIAHQLASALYTGRIERGVLIERPRSPIFGQTGRSFTRSPNYAAGSWGPTAADELLARDGRAWRTFEEEKLPSEASEVPARVGKATAGVH